MILVKGYGKFFEISKNKNSFESFNYCFFEIIYKINTQIKNKSETRCTKFPSREKENENKTKNNQPFH